MTKKIVAPFLRTPYNYDTNQAGDESGLQCQDKSLAKQSFADECDINTIVRRFNLTGELPSNVRMPTYGDFTGIFDFHSAMNAIALANESFDAMPAEVRARFHNNPAEFVAFCSDEANRDEARRLGLVKPEDLEATNPPKTSQPTPTPSPDPIPDEGNTPPPPAKPGKPPKEGKN